MRRIAQVLIPVLLTPWLAACGGGSESAPKIHSVGGSVSGLAGTLKLRNGAETITITVDGGFQFANRLSSGQSYRVSITEAPVNQTCTLTDASGRIDGASVSNVVVDCTTRRYAIGGTVTGLNGTVKLQNNNASDLSLTTNGSFNFATQGFVGTSYKVAVRTQPAGQTCTVSNGSGASPTNGAAVTNVAVSCVDNTNPFTVGGNISGLDGTVTLQNNDGDNLVVTSTGDVPFTFSAPLQSGTAYNVSVLFQPFGQICTVGSATGVVSANVGNVTVSCVNRTYPIAGTLSGLTSGLSLTLLNNGGDALVRNGNGSFTFATPIENGDDFDVTVQSQPAGQECLVTNGQGTVSGGGITGVTVTCSPRTYSVGFTVTGLEGSLIATLNGTNNSVSTDGSYTFTARVPHGGSYTTAIASMPIDQRCVVRNGTGSNVTADVTGVQIICGFIVHLSSPAPRDLRLAWSAVADSTHYRVYEDPDGSGYVQTGADIPAVAGITLYSKTLTVPVHLYDWRQASFYVEACNGSVCESSAPVDALSAMASAIGFFKQSNTGAGDNFGYTIALSADGMTMAVGAPREDGSATSTGSGTGSSDDDTATDAGAVYVFFYRSDIGWAQQAFLKAANANPNDLFGNSVALSADGNTLVIGAPGEASAATGIDGSNTDNSKTLAGAVYVFKRTGANWAQDHYLKASNTDAGDAFGATLALSADATTLVVGAPAETSASTGIDGNQASNTANLAGAAYVFTQSGGVWSQQAYLKASNTGSGDNFGLSIAMDSAGDTIAVGAPGESSDATTVNGAENNNNASLSGAVYVFTRSAGTWSQQAFVKARSSAGDTTQAGDSVGSSVALSANGDILAIGAPGDDHSDNATQNAGAAYVFRRSGSTWSQQVYLSAPVPGLHDRMGTSVALGGDRLAVGSPNEGGGDPGINGTHNNAAPGSGVLYLYTDNAGTWSSADVVKTSLPEFGDNFGSAIAFSADGSVMAGGAPSEDSFRTGIGGTQYTNLTPDAGAVYLY